MSDLVAGMVTDAATLPLAHEPVPSEQRSGGPASTGLHELGEFAGVSLGIWEMSEGAMTDTEADEVFVVLSGSATVEFIDPALPSIDLRPGSVVRLDAGMRTRWVVREALRKVYLAG